MDNISGAVVILNYIGDTGFSFHEVGPIRFEDMPEAMPRILAPGGLCHVITYGTE